MSTWPLRVPSASDKPSRSKRKAVTALLRPERVVESMPADASTSLAMSSEAVRERDRGSQHSSMPFSQPSASNSWIGQMPHTLTPLGDEVAIGLKKRPTSRLSR